MTVATKASLQTKAWNPDPDERASKSRCKSEQRRPWLVTAVRSVKGVADGEGRMGTSSSNNRGGRGDRIW